LRPNGAQGAAGGSRENAWHDPCLPP
jgi:hypothetical protein